MSWEKKASVNDGLMIDIGGLTLSSQLSGYSLFSFVFFVIQPCPGDTQKDAWYLHGAKNRHKRKEYG
jgi:hypothetical protein